MTNVVLLRIVNPFGDTCFKLSGRMIIIQQDEVFFLCPKGEVRWLCRFAFDILISVGKWGEITENAEGFVATKKRKYL
jgi:hypothetical protein